MKLKSLYLENFKYIQKIFLDFKNKKTILFEGKAGQGKSSIFEAIVYALTNTLNEKIEEFKREKNKIKYDFKIHLIFDHLGKEYDIEIISTKSGVNKKLIIDKDTKNIHLNSDASKELNKIINPVVTKYSAISEQEKSTVLLEQRPAERLRQFKEIFGIDNITFIVKKMKEDIRDIKSKIDILDAELKLLKGKEFSFQIIPNIDDNENELKDRIYLLEKDKEIYLAQNKLYEKYINELEKYEENKRKILDKKQENLQYEKDIIELNKQIKELPNFDENKLLELQTNLSNLEKEKIKYDNDLSKYVEAQRKISNLYKKIEIEKSNLNKYELKKIDECKYNENDINSEKLTIKNLSIKLKETENKIELAKQGKCPTCGKEYIIDINLLENERNEINHFLSVSEDDLEFFEKEIKNYNKEIEQNNLNKVKRNSIEDKILEFQNEIKELELIKEVGTKYFHIDELKEEFYSYKNLRNDFIDLKSKNDKVLNKISNLNRDIENNKKQIKEAESLEKPAEINKPVEFNFEKFETIKNSLLILQQKKIEIDRIRKYNESVQIEKTKNERLIILKERELVKLTNENKNLETAKDLLDKEFSSFVIDKGTVFIKVKMNDFFKRAYSRYEITFEQDKNSIEFFYKEPMGLPRPVTMSSGFEKQILSLATRISLCQMQNLGLLILDEVDSNAGSEDSLKLFNILLNENVNQILVITHNDETKELIQQRDDSIIFSIREGKII